MLVILDSAQDIYNRAHPFTMVNRIVKTKCWKKYSRTSTQMFSHYLKVLTLSVFTVPVVTKIKCVAFCYEIF